MKDRSIFLRVTLVVVVATTSAIPLGRPSDKEPPTPGVMAGRALTQPLNGADTLPMETGIPDANVWYAGHQHNQVLL
jgi:hypothetical protein